MLPEVRRYVDAVEAGAAVRSRAVDTADRKYDGRYSLSEEGRRQEIAYTQEINAAYATCVSVRAAAWDALKTSGDPLVKWIAENCGEYPAEAECVLTALPATVEVLDDLADKADWCGVWNNFREQAIHAGVLPGATPPSQARLDVFERIDREACCPMDARAKQRIGKALDALIREALAAAASAEDAQAVEATP
ncbi:hypothetical protein PV415_29675 [Streptomyces sp. ME03-5684b]|uniref:hypothetical protein n=1 Tax=Streptomyces sp. ME03-5684b TaxID=3028681 RepID=UPI0029B3CA47|nr:hypothetical protein [Streptomyces sp. ME03-5684b]MDX3321083.1 hypothetical protein [Streptomyces sp. ME03-5684b]